MSRSTTFTFGLIAASLFIANVAAPSIGAEPASQPVARPVPAPLHCQVPCGIYTDQLRFEWMLEDTKTIAKAIGGINDFASSIGDGTLTGTAINQANRWTTTKEDHASHVQEVMASYFLAQRIKSDNPQYVQQLTAAHLVIVSAMKCKQAADPATAEALKAAILDFYRAYEGKEPEHLGEE